MDLLDIEICSPGSTHLHRQRSRRPCPEALLLRTSRNRSADSSCNVANVQSAAYVGVAAILAVFILAFAAAPKVRSQDDGHHVHLADHQSKSPGLPLFARRS
jgi:hypothetical protein